MIVEFKNVFRWTTFILVFNQGYCNLFNNEFAICSSDSTSRFFLNSGDVKTIYHSYEMEVEESVTNNVTSSSFPSRCAVKVGSCHSCHLVVSVVYLKMATCSDDGSCRCDYLSVKEPEYEKSGKHFCGFLTNTSNIYESQTKWITVEYISSNFKSAFSIQIRSYKNVYIIRGHSSNFKLNNTGFIESPYFPTKYSSDFSSEFKLENSSPNGLVQLTFVDFQLSPWSFIEIYDRNNTSVENYNGNVFRPPVILSAGPNLSVKFVANEEYPSHGFRAQYLFIGSQDKIGLSAPMTDCGGKIEGYGGTLTLLDISLTEPSQAYDCIWLIKPSSKQVTHVALKVVKFENFAPRTSLKIREGIFSKSYLLETLTASEEKRQSPTRSLEYTAHAETGFYVRLKGHFTNQSQLAIVFTAFQFGCIPNRDFRCNNGRCIKPILHCDGYNHCGDGSDEVACQTNLGTLSPENSNYMTPNFYFPRQETTSSAGTNTLILITSLAGLGMFLLTTALILVKLHKQRRDDAINRDVLSTISADVDSSPARNPFNSIVEPPLYDPPPSYDDVIKYYLPPPPTYTSVIAPRTPNSTILGQFRNGHNGAANGIENAGFVPDALSEYARVAASAQRRCIAPTILTVILPARQSLDRNSLQRAEPALDAIVPTKTVTEVEVSLVGKESSDQPMLIDVEDTMIEHNSTSVQSSFSPTDRPSSCHKCACKGACSCPMLNVESTPSQQ